MEITLTNDLASCEAILGEFVWGPQYCHVQSYWRVIDDEGTERVICGTCLGL